MEKDGSMSKETKFNCEKYKHICKSRCCGVFPILKEIIERNRDKIVREVKEEIPVKLSRDGIVEEHIILNTPDLYCAFLKEDLTCNIYEDRDRVCRMFGDDTKIFCHCPHQDKDGNPR